MMKPNRKYLFYHHLLSSAAEYQQYNVLNCSKKRRNLTHCRDPLIFTGLRVNGIQMIFKVISPRDNPPEDVCIL